MPNDSPADPDAAVATSSPDVIGGPQLAGPGLAVDRPTDVPAPPTTNAKSWVLADLDTGSVLAAQGAHLRLRPASTLKMLTALALLPQLDPGTVYTAGFDDANVIGSRVGIVPGATYTVDNLFDGLFLSSGNDAAHALAMAAGGLEPTLAAMNGLAAGLQALDTHAANTSGLDEDDQWSSAYDLALIARAGLAREDFRSYAAARRSTFPGEMPEAGSAERETFEIYNQNRLLGSYDGAIGVKTGYTSQARNTFVGAAVRDGRTLLVTLMNTRRGAADEAAALLDWGFAHADAVTPVGQLVEPLEAALPDAEPAPDATLEPPATAADPAPPLPAAVFGLGVLLGCILVLRVRAVHRARRRRARRALAGRRGTVPPPPRQPSSLRASRAPSRSRSGGRPLTSTPLTSTPLTSTPLPPSEQPESSASHHRPPAQDDQRSPTRTR
jgi:D-alanyl-D-alanine carboxypeptidase (penicillin-binding protein 5/6)